MINDLISPLIVRYLAEHHGDRPATGPIKLPPIDRLASELGVSVGKLREDLIAAEAFGLVEMRPGDGTYVRPFDFYAAIRPLILYSVTLDERNFDRIYRLRSALEVAFWDSAVQALDGSDLQALEGLMQQAERKLAGPRVEIPHREHREWHRVLFGKLDNPFVRGLLEVYWDAYEVVGLHRYFDLPYYRGVWASHRAIVATIQAHRYDEGKDLLQQHHTFLSDRLQGDRTNEDARGVSPGEEPHRRSAA